MYLRKGSIRAGLVCWRGRAYGYTAWVLGKDVGGAGQICWICAWANYYYLNNNVWIGERQREPDRLFCHLVRLRLSSLGWQWEMWCGWFIIIFNCNSSERIVVCNILHSNVIVNTKDRQRRGRGRGEGEYNRCTTFYLLLLQTSWKILSLPQYLPLEWSAWLIQLIIKANQSKTFQYKN